MGEKNQNAAHVSSFNNHINGMTKQIYFIMIINTYMVLYCYLINEKL